MEHILVLISLFHLIYSPYTKVEESFNMQAMHDILYHRWNFSEYDHLEFPGVVPRTFIGPLFISLVSSLLVAFISIFGVGTKFFAQYIVRGVLSLCVTFSLIKFQRTVKSIYGPNVAWWYLAVTVTQYHILYYSSRPLPNTLALILFLLAVDAAFNNNTKMFFWFSGMAIVWFRFELALLLGALFILKWKDNRFPLKMILELVIPIGGALIAVSMLIDSFFWQRLVWPEAEVFYFNIILNKSSDWGTSPFLWYFYSALPRGLASSIFLVPVGFYFEPRVRRITLIALFFVSCFSFLPHKELRFIFYVFPLFNISVASACHRLWSNREKSLLQFVFGLGVAGHLLINVIFTTILLGVAGWNYPGGVAMHRLHQLVPADRPVRVHVANLAAQTGITRFTQINSNWSYFKTENLSIDSEEIKQFSHLLVEAKSKYSANLRPFLKTHTILAAVEGFSHVSMNYLNFFPPIKIKTKPCIYILEKHTTLQKFEDKYYEEKEVLSVEKIEPEESEKHDEEEYEEPIVTTQESVPDAEDENITDTEDENITDTENENIEDQIAEETAVNASDDSIKQLLEDYDTLINSKEQDDDSLNEKWKLLDQSLMQEDIINEIKKLSKMDLDGENFKIDNLKGALKVIFDDYKRHVDRTAENISAERQQSSDNENNEL